MNIDYYKIFNIDEFLAANIPSRTYTLDLEDIGERDILVTQGNLTSLTYEGVMLPIGLVEAEVFVFEGYASYLDTTTGSVYLGIVTDEN